ncbi:DEAD/DEAH box helicase family protein [Staphylococcus equorum]|uniref:DEAD/DEAH box helicase family protein n=1 Tax=Staphylococcus equorum TaxID=246432 RepID=A0A9X4R0L4_9STAP|nr:DEAD/DEAH box helicase family protein [Staphylococcus equorum]MDG0843031.1 DEAD/DEAH box helicase family protein [Staphylococcus equorum]MDG0859017.1 DEAD/DEAH box helicase family protein [Staphylococcus equorum]
MHVFFYWRSSKIKHYGKLITEKYMLTDEKIVHISTGVINKQGRWYCIQCHTKERHYFYKYFSILLDKEVVYCRNCINLSRMDNINEVYITETNADISQGIYQLPFELSEQQHYASIKILEAVKSFKSILLYAVTGAGKTEMIFEGLSFARRKGYNVAIVSPRIDVVIEVSLRIKAAFKDEAIDVLYQGQRQCHNGHFVIATVHQLYRFKQHFDMVIVDEVDAFPLSMDPTLFDVITHASKQQHCHIYMTATPSTTLLRKMKGDHIVTLPARFHRQPLPVPQFKHYKTKFHKTQRFLMKILKQQIESGRYTLVFFNRIHLMKQMYHCYKTEITSMTCVHSEDALRFEKVRGLRKGEYKVMFTTTILERGFTMANLDVIVLNSHMFESSALVQIAGRVGRKLEAPTGSVLFLHEGITMSMLKARKDIKKMNMLAHSKGWLDG